MKYKCIFVSSSKFLSFFILMLFIISVPLFGYDAKTHARHLCQVLFGYNNSEELNNAVSSSTDGGKTQEAYECMRRAVSVAIDEQFKKGKASNDYKELRKRVVHKGVRIPNIEEFEIRNVRHREQCHQGFDYTYSNTEYNKRWQIGRKLIIDVARVSFTSERGVIPYESTVEFIAMISYYTHILGDLEIGETKSMKTKDSQNNLGSFKGFIYELIQKINTYGYRLKDTSGINQLISELRICSYTMPAESASSLNNGNTDRQLLGEKIRSILRSYIPQIISRNIDSSFCLNTNSITQQKVA